MDFLQLPQKLGFVWKASRSIICYAAGHGTGRQQKESPYHQKEWYGLLSIMGGYGLPCGGGAGQAITAERMISDRLRIAQHFKAIRGIRGWYQPKVPHRETVIEWVFSKD